jgi:cupin fold WbuC family metalloprotein
MSRKTPDRLLHAIVDPSFLRQGRVDVSPSQEWLQLSLIALDAGGSIRPHTHDVKPLKTDDAPNWLTQEAWVVMRGSVRIRLYDEDHERLDELTLDAGRLVVTFHGGHSFFGAEPGTLLLECKNGPFTGRAYTPFEESAS